MGRSLIVASVAGLCALAPLGLARATTCPAPPGAQAAVAAIDGRARLLWIDQRLGQEASKGRRWAYGWAIGIGAAGLGSLVPVPFVAASDRVDWYASAATAAIGVVPFIVSPLKVTRDAPEVRAAIATMPSDDAHVCAVLADAEHKLSADAVDERRQRGWWIHLGNVAFNTGVLLFLGLGYHHWGSGLINGLSGVAVGETIIFTQPTGAIDDAGSYNRGDLSTGSADLHASRPFGWAYETTF